MRQQLVNRAEWVKNLLTKIGSAELVFNGHFSHTRARHTPTEGRRQETQTRNPQPHGNTEHVCRYIII